MKQVTLIVLFFICSISTFAQGILGLINQSEDFFDLLNKGKYEDARLYFDESLKDKVTVEALTNLWANITSKLGALEAIDGAQSKREGEYFVVSITCKFSKNSQSFRFAYNAANKLVGFSILPTNQVAAYVPPAYADTALYKEQYISIGTAPRQLAGILTVPKTGANFPVVVLVHGSGPADMDETVGPNKPFKDLAAGLAAKGIATIRYVKRTLIYPGEFKGAFTVKEEVIDDALTAIALARALPQINKKQLYLLGHSLGGMLAPRIVALAPDLAGVVLACAPARKFTDLMAEQNINIFSGLKDTTKLGRETLEKSLRELEITRITKLGTIRPDSLILFAPASYWVDINTYDQVAAAKKLKNKVLIIQGENDIQVSAEDYKLWKAAMAAKKNAVFKLYPAIDHLLSPQTEKDWTGTYRKQVNVADYVVNDIAAWILN